MKPLSIFLFVLSLHAQSVSIDNPPKTIAVGASQQLSASLSDGSVPTVIWLTSDPTIATVTIQGGLLTGIAPGTVTITARMSQNAVAVVAITVQAATPPPVTPPPVVVQGAPIIGLPFCGFVVADPPSVFYMGKDSYMHFNPTGATPAQ